MTLLPWTILSALCLARQPTTALRINQVQIVGTHNSYHAGLDPAEMAILEKQNQQAAKSLAYRHPKIEAQLDAGVRQLELDVFGDAQGGLFADPLFLRLSKAAMPEGWLEAMKKPGFKVLHVNDVDFRSHCFTLVNCLHQVRGWSTTHTGHLPIFIQIENKDGRARAGFAQPEPITKESMDALDREILSVFSRAELITPDDVRGSYETLEKAVLAEGWPLLDSGRGKVAFVLDQERVTPLYVEGHPALRGRVMFTNGKPGDPDAAFVKVNNPMSPKIPELVRKGYLVRTMTDGGGNTSRRDAAIASGAQILSTDYPFDWKMDSSGFQVELPGGLKARCNPLNAPPGCSASSLQPTVRQR
jgi:hypothetical protein